MNLLEFIQTGGPYGDATSTYKVKINKENATVADIINYVIDKTEDWGYICIDEFLSDKTLKYKYGTILSDTIPAEYKNKIVTTISAHGGWSRLDYIINVK